MGLLDVLVLIFIVLKLCGTVAWSWWWVLSPLWMGYAIVGGLFIIYLLLKTPK